MTHEPIKVCIQRSHPVAEEWGGWFAFDLGYWVDTIALNGDPFAVVVVDTEARTIPLDEVLLLNELGSGEEMTIELINADVRADAMRWFGREA